MFIDLITVTILNTGHASSKFQISHLNTISISEKLMGQITFGNYTVTTHNFFVITIHYVNVVLTPTVCIN